MVPLAVLRTLQELPRIRDVSEADGLSLESLMVARVARI
jgi:hypothetical protein